MDKKRLKILITIISIPLLLWGVYLWVTRGSWTSGAFANCASLQICPQMNAMLQSRDTDMYISLGVGIILLILLWLMGEKEKSVTPLSKV